MTPVRINLACRAFGVVSGLSAKTLPHNDAGSAHCHQCCSCSDARCWGHCSGQNGSSYPRCCSAMLLTHVSHAHARGRASAPNLRMHRRDQNVCSEVTCSCSAASWVTVMTSGSLRYAQRALMTWWRGIASCAHACSIVACLAAAAVCKLTRRRH